MTKRRSSVLGSAPLPKRKSATVAVLDVGTAKTVCVIARLMPHDGAASFGKRTHKAEVLGFGHYRSEGIKSGYVIDIERAEYAIRQAVHQAERMANVTLDSILVSLTGGRLGSETLSATVSLDGHAVAERDISRVLRSGRDHVAEPGRSILHSKSIGFSLDGDRGIQDPRGMYGTTLGVDMHVVTAEDGPLRNLELAVNRAHLEVEGYVTAGHAAGLSVLVEDEMDLGTVCLDLGAGTTSIAVFYDGEFIHANSVPLGGHHVTMDLARGLSTPVEEAERLKTLYGSAFPGAADDRELITISPVGESSDDQGQQVVRASMTRIIRPRLEEILEMVRDRLEESGYAKLAAKRLVLTGGASQMNGFVELTRRIVSRNVRVGRPLDVDGLPEAGRGPAFAGVTGMLIYPQQVLIMPEDQGWSTRPSGTGNYLERVGQWLRQAL